MEFNRSLFLNLVGDYLILSDDLLPVLSVFFLIFIAASSYFAYKSEKNRLANIMERYLLTYKE